MERDEPALDCPNSDELARRVAQILQRPLDASGATPDLLRIRVRFTRERGGYGAELGFEGAKRGERTLRDQGQSCGALTEAVSVTIALLLDTELAEKAASEETAAPPAAPPLVPATIAEPTSSPAQTEPTSKRSSVLAAFEGGAAWFTSSKPQPLLFGRVGVQFKPWMLEGGFGVALPTTHSFGPGEVTTGLLFGSARACYTFTSALWLGPCVEFGLGSLRGSGRQFVESRSVSLLWSAVGIGLLLQGELGARGYWGATAVGWVPTHSQTFSVENAGVAWESPTVAGSFALRAGLRVW